MQLKKIKISKFRNFVGQFEISVTPYTVLIGPNNKGKSNIIDAINIFFSQSRFFTKRSRLDDRGRFDITRDYPAALKTGRRWPTEISCTFSVDNVDHDNCKVLSGVSDICIVKKWNYESKKFVYSISGFSEEKIASILEYTFTNIRIVSIPAIRDVKNLENYLSQIFRETIEASLEHSRKIATLRETLHKLVEPEVEKAKNNINDCLSRFLKNAKLGFVNRPGFTGGYFT